MIYVNKLDVSEDDFKTLLEKTKQNCLVDIVKTDPKNISSTDFENIVERQANISAKGTGFENHIKRAGPNSFPDILAKGYFGIEVKITIGDKWVTTGNSVLEGNRSEKVKRIYIFFGKLGGKSEIKFRLYQECLFDIGVTHSPRYKIDMNLPTGKSIFDKMKIEYDDLRLLDNPISKIKDYYRSKLSPDEELWWIDPQVDEPISPIIKSLNKLSTEEKEKFVVETMILFPEIFGNSPNKYERPAAYLMTSRTAVSSNLRDFFTAGGQKKLRVLGKVIKVERVLFKLYQRADSIEKILREISGEKLLTFWREKNVIGNKVDRWKYLLNKRSGWKKGKLKATDIFEAGLSAEK